MAIVLQSSNLKIDEEVIYKKDGEELYKFQLQLTGEELNKIRKIMEISAKSENEEETLKLQDEFEDITFKEHKEEFKKIAGDNDYLEMVDELYFFILNGFIDKRLKSVKSINTKLQMKQ